MKKLIILLITSRFGLGTVMLAQETIPASGGNATGTGGSASYSIGQIVYTINTGTNFYIVQGVQQPYEISVLTAIGEKQEISLSSSVYPNPTTEFLVLKVENFSNENLSYQLLDINGKLLENKKVSGDETSIFMGNLFPATYILKVLRDDEEIQSFKIIKY